MQLLRIKEQKLYVKFRFNKRKYLETTDLTMCLKINKVSILPHYGVSLALSSYPKNVSIDKGLNSLGKKSD